MESQSRKRPEEVITLFRAQTSRANDIVVATPLDAPPKRWPDFFGSWRLADVRHPAPCHHRNGVPYRHLDAARELIDGRTWLLL